MHQEMLTKNLSVQVHPRQGVFVDRPAKTEAWTIIDAEEGAGIYLGLKENVTKAQFEETMRSGKDVSNYLNFVEVKAGDVFFIPTGTLHAIGAGVLLLEVQETSETTFRAYDWGRLSEGKPRQLHFDETMAATSWEDARGQVLVEELRRKPKKDQHQQVLVDEKEFRQMRLTFSQRDDDYEGDTSLTGIQAFTVINGSVKVHAGESAESFGAGCSLIIPAAVGSYRLVAEKDHTVVMQVRGGK